ncbi:hypothetical protein AA103196_2973 [Ameyamaea chiangmaiensis NBRC 103196]|nr:chemotaxis protein CheW [Ameyamaea chiangmaiensis]MBS4074461.1 chemotaxis protein CheW [Ameyamaea chiangmaiensis]GBQ72123.1 hypothetical protein AA103196_2973 [Ameyamaea chiangmaiensis NBRC 103196]
MQGPFVIFRLGHGTGEAVSSDQTHDFALATAVVRECVALPLMRRPPDLPPAIAGLFALGHETITVVDPAPLLGCDTGPAQTAEALYRAVILLHGHPPVGLLVTRVVDVLRVPGALIRPPEDAAAGWVRGRFDHDGRTVTLFDPGDLLDAQALEQAAARDRVAAEQAALWGRSDDRAEEAPRG